MDAATNSRVPKLASWRMTGIGLFLAQAGLYLGLDRRLTRALGRWGFLASGSFPKALRGTSRRTPHVPVSAH